jgi:HSP20 family molecular chaperone IbpA
MLIKHIDAKSLKEMEKFMKELLNTDFGSTKQKAEDVKDTVSETIDELSKKAKNIWEFDKTEKTAEYKLKEEGDLLTVAVPVVGISKEQVSVSMSDNVLLIETNAETLPFGSKNINLTLVLRDDFINSDIDAVCENGLLSIFLTKKAPKQKIIKIM